MNIISKAPWELCWTLGRTGGDPVGRVEVQLLVTGGSPIKQIKNVGTGDWRQTKQLVLNYFYFREEPGVAECQIW